MNTNTLLVDPAVIQLQKIISENDSIIFVVMTKSRSAKCPRCGASSGRIHSRYTRRIADLPWQGVAARLELHARKFRCANDLCQQNIFCERLPSVVARYARKTTRLSHALTLIGFCLGGRPGARLSSELMMMSPGRDALLRLVRRAPHEEHATPAVLGVDDWAKRKGATYGTILVDLERRRPVELLAEREVGTFAAWLKAHPGVEVISRDRGGTYAEGARAGAPHAIQVADRWHLLKNLGDVVERVVSREHKFVRQAIDKHRAVLLTAEKQRFNAALNETATAEKDLCRQRGGSSSSITPHAQARQSESRARRLAVYEEVVNLRQSGVKLRAIARQLGIGRNTVRRYTGVDEFPERALHKRRASILDRFASHLKTRLGEGCWCGVTLWEEVRTLGFAGSVDVVQRFVAKCRRKLPTREREALQRRTSGRRSCKGVMLNAYPSPHELRWLLLRRMERLSDDERTLLDELFTVSYDLTTTYAFAQSFQQIVRNRDADKLATWLGRALKCAVSEVRSFAFGIHRDYDAVHAALTTEWSNGQTEGQVNRLKMIKRQMYGRANFDLLRARVLHAT